MKRKVLIRENRMKNEIIFSRFHIVYWLPGCVCQCLTIVAPLSRRSTALATFKRLNAR